MSTDAPTENDEDAPRRASGPYTPHVEALLKQKKSKSKLGRKLKSASDNAVVVYSTVGPILQTAINGVPWFGPAASAVVQLLNRAIVSPFAIDSRFRSCLTDKRRDRYIHRTPATSVQKWLR